MQDKSPTQLYCVAAGALLLAWGIVGFFYNGSFTSNDAVHDDVFGVFRVNGWVNLLHIAAGAAALAVRPSPRVCASALGLLLVALGVWGIVLPAGHSILGILPMNTADDVLHLAIGIAGLGAAAVSARRATVPA